MGKKDVVTKKYMSDSAVFADAFNYLVYDGEQVINPNNLRPLDTAIADVPYTTEAKLPVQKVRDELKYVTAMTDEKTVYLILGIENQSDIHYAMPVKTMVYDALEYASQVSKAAARHKENRDAATSAEYLSGFHKADKLIPVITLTVYFGSDEWDGPMSLYDMLELPDERAIKFVENYKIRLISPAALSEEDFEKFRKNLREVMAYIKYSEDKNKLMELVNNDEEFTKLDVKAAMVLNACTKSDIRIGEDKEVIDVCQAIKDIRSDGIREGRMEGRMEGRAEGLLSSIKNLMKTLSLTAEQAMNALKIPEAERADYLARI